MNIFERARHNALLKARHQNLNGYDFAQILNPSESGEKTTIDLDIYEEPTKTKQLQHEKEIHIQIQVQGTADSQHHQQR